jgi:HAMP domain-containing protein
MTILESVGECSMKRNTQSSQTAQANGVAVAEAKGRTNGHESRSQPEIRALLHGLQAVRDGDFTVRLPGDWTGLEGKIADTFNEIVAANQQMEQELWRVGHVVGKEGKTRERTKFAQSKGAWGEMEVSINTLVDDLLRPTTEVTRAISAVAQGDLRQTVRLDVDGRPLEGEFLRSATIVNTMIQQLGVFTSEVTRVAREVGTDGKLGGQAQVPEVSGVWKDLTDSVNFMAGNLTAQPMATSAARSPSTCAARSCCSRMPSIRWLTSCARSRPR